MHSPGSLCALAKSFPWTGLWNNFNGEALFLTNFSTRLSTTVENANYSTKTELYLNLLGVISWKFCMFSNERDLCGMLNRSCRNQKKREPAAIRLEVESKKGRQRRSKTKKRGCRRRETVHPFWDTYRTGIFPNRFLLRFQGKKLFFIPCFTLPWNLLFAGKLIV